MKAAVFTGVIAAALAVCSTQAEAATPMRRHHEKNEMRLQARQGRERFSGTATWYAFDKGALGACGIPLDPNDYVVALNEGQYGNLGRQSPLCGQTITITNGQKTTQARIMDACPQGVQCHHGALDMSRSLFSFFNDFGVGVFDIEWWMGSGSSPSGNSGNRGNNNSNNNDDDDDEAQSNRSRVAANRQREQREREQREREQAREQAAEEREEERREREQARQDAAERREREREQREAREAAAERQAEEEREAARQAAAERIQQTQQDNLASFGQIMETLNDMVTDAAAPASSASATTSA